MNATINTPLVQVHGQTLDFSSDEFSNDESNFLTNPPLEINEAPEGDCENEDENDGDCVEYFDVHGQILPSPEIIQAHHGKLPSRVYTCSNCGRKYWAYHQASTYCPTCAIEMTKAAHRQEVLLNRYARELKKMRETTPYYDADTKEQKRIQIITGVPNSFLFACEQVLSKQLFLSYGQMYIWKMMNKAEYRRWKSAVAAYYKRNKGKTIPPYVSRKRQAICEEKLKQAKVSFTYWADTEKCTWKTRKIYTGRGKDGYGL